MIISGRKSSIHLQKKGDIETLPGQNRLKEDRDSLQSILSKNDLSGVIQFRDKGKSESGIIELFMKKEKPIFRIDTTDLGRTNNIDLIDVDTDVEEDDYEKLNKAAENKMNQIYQRKISRPLTSVFKPPKITPIDNRIRSEPKLFENQATVFNPDFIKIVSKKKEIKKKASLQKLRPHALI